MTVTVRPMTAADWPEVCAICEAGIATSNATFETSAPTWEQWDASHLAKRRLVAHDGDGRIAGRGGAVTRVGPMRLHRRGRE